MFVPSPTLTDVRTLVEQTTRGTAVYVTHTIRVVIFAHLYNLLYLLHWLRLLLVVLLSSNAIA